MSIFIQSNISTNLVTFVSSHNVLNPFPSAICISEFLSNTIDSRISQQVLISGHDTLQVADNCTATWLNKGVVLETLHRFISSCVSCIICKFPIFSSEISLGTYVVSFLKVIKTLTLERYQIDFNQIWLWKTYCLFVTILLE